MNMKTTLNHFATAALILTLFSLTGCEHVSKPKKPTSNIYQAPILRLEQGTRVQTVDGVYEAQTDEVWHSDDRYRKLERELFEQ